jgi:hypothetical protein
MTGVYRVQGHISGGGVWCSSRWFLTDVRFVRREKE